MKKVNPVNNESEVLDQATQWVVELNSGELSEARTKMLHAWLRESPLHEAKLLEVSDVWDETKNLIAETKAVPSASKAQWIFRPSMGVAALLVVTLAGVLTSGVMNFETSDQVVFNAYHETRIGEFKTITLSDSSRVTLNTNSRISVEFNDQSKVRRISLLQGEGYFDVAKDAQRPFVVDVNNREVRAIGTAFNIKSGSRYIEVIVKEGVVELTDDKSNSTQTKETNIQTDRLIAGQVIEIENGTKELSLLLPEILEKKLSWQTGRIIFEGDQLKDVISEVSRYTKTKFIFSDKQTESIRIGGSFRIGNVAELFDSIEEGFNVDVETRSDGTIVLSSLDL